MLSMHPMAICRRLHWSKHYYNCFSLYKSNCSSTTILERRRQCNELNAQTTFYNENAEKRRIDVLFKYVLAHCNNKFILGPKYILWFEPSFSKVLYCSTIPLSSKCYMIHKRSHLFVTLFESCKWFLYKIYFVLIFMLFPGKLL